VDRAFLISLLYLAAVLVLLWGGWRTATARSTYGAAYFAAGLALLAFALPAIAAGFGAR
jgi:TRAP-type C4-dicarboxylate transport system permease small subunit